MSKKLRFASFILALVMVVSSVPVVPAYAQNEDTISEITNPFRSDVSFTAGDSTVTSNSFRIPSMVTLANGTIVAAADIRWNTTYDGGGLDTLVARSTDGGKTWSYNAANYLGDNENEYNYNSTTFIDPSLLVAADGQTVYMLVDLYAYGVALNGLWETNTKPYFSYPEADTGFDANGNLKLSNNGRSSFGYYLKDGRIYANSAAAPLDGYLVDDYFNITYTSNGETVKTNLFCGDSPFKVARTQFLYLTKSTDGGATWSAPSLLNLRNPAGTTAKNTDEDALLVSPGNAITTSDGVMVYPVYSYAHYTTSSSVSNSYQHMGLIYSADGVNWERTENFTEMDFSSEGSVIELANGDLRVFFRNDSGYLCYVDYDLQAKAWKDCVKTAIPTNSNTQLSAISYSKDSDGKQIVLISCPTGPNEKGSTSGDGSCRTNGKIHVFTVDVDGKMKLENEINLFETAATGPLSGSNYLAENGFFAYSSITELSDGSLAILYENNQFGWGAGKDKYYTMDFKQYRPSALGLTLDEPQTVIMDANGALVDSIAMGQYEKPELTAKAPFNSSDVAYQWQIEYENGKWVDIYGEDSKTVKLSFGMVATLLGNDGQVDIRCETTAGAQVAYSKPITVTIEMYQSEEPDVVVSDSFVTSSGETVTVTVAGTLPDGASVVLDETDSTGVDVNPNETVVAALDISIKNADGTEWQPESGETVSVTLEASKIGLKNGDEFVVYHLHNGEVRVLGSYEVVNNTVSFEVDGFSKFVFARTEDEAVIETPDFSENIGKHAHFAWNDNIVNIEATDEGPDEHFSETAKAYLISDFSTDFTLKIDGYKVVTQYGTITAEDQADSQNGSTILDSILNLLWGKNQGSQTNTEETIEIRSLWYQVSVVNGTAPEDFVDGCWILQNYLTEADAYPVDALVLFDAPEAPEEPEEPCVGVTVNGQKVTEITVSTAQKVTLTATPNVEGSNVTFSWQLLIPQSNMWVDISGQTDAKCTVNYGMVANRIDADGNAYIRCVATVDGKEIISEPITVNIGETPVYRFSMSRSAAASGAEITSVVSDSAGIKLAADGDVGEGTKYTLTVKFQLGDTNSELYQPYIAEFKQGEVRSINVPVPNKAGYWAEYSGIAVVDNKILMEGKSLTENEEIIVRYYPKDTKYTVIHKVQNIHNDEYSVYLEETDLTGLTDSQVPDNLHFAEEDLPGFYKIPYVRPTIAADGSTVVEIYYDRYYYLMNFDLGQGGFGVEPAYARYETEINFGMPTRKGYIFEGWSLDQTAVTSPVSMPAHDCTIVAIWKASNAKYTIVYWKENAESNADGTYGYSYWTSRVVDATSGTSVSGKDDVAGYVTDAAYFTYNDIRTDKNVLVKGDGSTVVNVYYLRNYYDIYFYVDDINSCQVTPHTHGDGDCSKYLICGLEDNHTHDTSCEEMLACGTTEHTHSEECCTKVVHAQHTATCCTLSTTHTHTRSCYAGNNITVNAQNADNDYRLSNAPEDPVEGYVYVYRYDNSYKYVYTNGHWYRIRNTQYQTGDIATTFCGGSHTHGDGKCTCTQELHTHGDGTCTCPKIEHTHSNSCYKYSCGEVQHTHTGSCYGACTKAEHTHSNNNCRDDGQYLLKIIHAKYEADISADWPVANDSIPGLQGFAYWSGNSSAGSQSSRVVTMNSDWAKTNGVKVNANYNSAKYQLNYWFEDFDQTDDSTSSTRELHNGKYYVLSDKYTQVAYYGSTSSWSYKKITGMEASANSASISNGTANLYYNRSTHVLTLESYNEEVTKETGVMFEKPLNYYLDENGNCTVVPDYPTGTLEEGGYYFAGWYTTKECFNGTQFDFATETMPNSDLTLYAKWAPVEHTIEFYFDQTLSQKLSDEDGFVKQVVEHNNYGADPGLPGHPLDFDAIVWFYKDENGNEHSFDFSMQVKHDMKLYPKWRSNVFIDYEIHYLIEGTKTAIAEPTVGQDLYGESVTFGPKGQDDFYPAYRGGGYFAVTPTHNIVMGETTCATDSPHCYWDENAKKHVFTFYYTEGPTVPYTVRYLDKETGNQIFPDKIVSDNRKAIVVENALIKVGYRPDEAQKSLVVVKGGSNNVITFYYEQDEKATYYTISHYIKKYGTNEYVLYQDATPYNATVGDIVPNQTHIMIDGFTYIVTDNTVLGGTVREIGPNGEPGLEIKMYYDEKPVTINYEVIGNFGGTVSPGSNTLGMVYGTAAGSTATPENGTYRFVGWYADWEGKEMLSANAKFVPTKEADEKWIDGTTYYAKFEYNLTSLTIDKTFPSGADYSIDENQSFLFDVVEIDESGNEVTNGVNLTVTIHGDGDVAIAGLTVGHRYKITEKTDWSWRYGECAPSSALTNSQVIGNSITVELTADAAANKVTFTNKRTKVRWLSGDSYWENQFVVNTKKQRAKGKEAE